MGLLGYSFPDGLHLGDIPVGEWIEFVAEGLDVHAELVLPHGGDVIWPGYVFQIIIEEAPADAAETVALRGFGNELNHQKSTISSRYSESSSNRVSWRLRKAERL